MKRTGIFLLVLSIVLLCSACDGYDFIEKYPHYKADYWYCEQIDFGFYYEYHESGQMKPPSSYRLKKDGETLNVFIDFIVDSWYMDLDNGDDLITLEEQLMEGHWEYRKGDLVLTVEKDNLFGMKYAELIFVAGK